MKEIGRSIQENVFDIIALWQKAADEEPWLSLPTKDQIDHLAPLLIALAEAALIEPGREKHHMQLAQDSATHGQDRRGQGFAEEVLLREYHFVRHALEQYLSADEKNARVQPEAMIRLDSALSLAMRASLLGFHRQQLEKAGRWPDKLDELVAESPVLRRYRQNEREEGTRVRPR